MAWLGLRRLGAVDGARGRIDGMAALWGAFGGMGARMAACERRAEFFSAFLSRVVGAGRRHWRIPPGLYAARAILATGVFGSSLGLGLAAAVGLRAGVAGVRVAAAGNREVL